MGGVGQAQPTYLHRAASAFASSEVQNRKIFLSFFKKIPPARKKEKEWKIFLFLKPATGWCGSRA